MNWERQIKKATVQYSGTCNKCGEYVTGGQECSLKLPAQDSSNPLLSRYYCPMRMPKGE